MIIIYNIIVFPDLKKKNQINNKNILFFLYSIGK